ncbi:MAG TPA: hypothetical protein VFC17_10065 [Candidatus Limnocylindrales bacterium]|nr:hypothetical protein [Candidatus Limnocylindrales bacterium]
MKKKSSPARQPKKSAKVARPETAVAPAKVAFPIVGIGASAGGLEALEHFLVTVSKTLETKLRNNQSVLEKHVAEQSTKLKRRQRKSKP